MLHRSLFTAFTIATTITAAAQLTCSTALMVVAGSHSVAGITGTQQALPICITQGDTASLANWYRYTPTQDYAITITTDLPQNEGRDTRFHVYTGSCAALTCVNGDDDSGSGYLSVATFNVFAGNIYYIAFDNFWDGDAFDFMLTEAAPMMISFSAESLPAGGLVKCVVDMNGDFLDDVVRVATTYVTILRQEATGGFTSTNVPTETAENTPSWSIAAGDLTGNGYNDLLYGGGQGVSFMLANDNGTQFTQSAGPEYVFSQRSNFVDINNDGHLDAFVCHDVLPNVYYINDGTGGLTFNQGGLGDTPDGGNYGSIWIDYDDDGDMDLYIAKCRGGNTPAKINQLHRNNGDGTFTEVAAQHGLADPLQTWSAAWGDYDNDGDLDIMVGAFSFSDGGHKLIRNDGNGVFTDVTAGSGFDTMNHTNIEHVTHDFNNDGWLDVFSGGNMIMMNNGDMTFTPSAVPMNNGPIGDINNDGFLDVVVGSTAYMNDGNNNNWIKFNTVGTVSNYNGIGARVKIQSAMGQQIREVRSGDGFGFMSSLNIHFGLGQDTEVDMVTITWPSGIVDTLYDVPANAAITVVEGSTNTTSIEEPEASDLTLYPLPATDRLWIQPAPLGDQPVFVLDMKGRFVAQLQQQNSSVDVSRLAPGMYLLHLNAGERIISKRFSKL